MAPAAQQADEQPQPEDPAGQLTPAQQQLVTDHLAFAERGAKRYCRMYFQHSFEEYRSAAYLGLVEAAIRFDAGRGVKFTTYAFAWIDRRLQRVSMEWKRQNGWAYQPTKAEQEIGAHGMQRVVKIGAWPVNDDGDQMDIAAPAAASDEDEQRREDVQHLAAIVLATVRKPKWRRIMALRFDGLTMEEVSKAVGVTRQRVHQIEKATIARAQRKLRTTRPELFTGSART